MKLIIPLKRNKKYLPGLYKRQTEFFERNFKKKELDYIKKNCLEKKLKLYVCTKVVRSDQRGIKMFTKF